MGLLLLLVSCFSSVLTLCDPVDSPPGSPDPAILQAGVGCHFFLQCRKMKSESEVAQSYLTRRDCLTAAYQAPPSMGFFQARVLKWGAIAFSV